MLDLSDGLDLLSRLLDAAIQFVNGKELLHRLRDDHSRGLRKMNESRYKVTELIPEAEPYLVTYISPPASIPARPLKYAFDLVADHAVTLKALGLDPESLNKVLDKIEGMMFLQQRAPVPVTQSQLQAWVSRIESAKARPEPGCVVLGGPGEPAIVLGKEKRLTSARYDVVKALLAAGPTGLSKDRLVSKSGHEDAVKILKRLAKDPDWEPVISLPGKKGMGLGYRLR